MTGKKNGNNKKTPLLDKETLDLLVQTLREDAGNQEHQNTGTLDPSDSSSVLKHLLMAFLIMNKKISTLEGIVREGTRGDEDGNKGQSEVKDQVQKLQDRLRLQEDELDELNQRGRKGNLVLSSPNIPARKQTSLFQTEEVLQAKNQTFDQHVTELVYLKYGVRIPESDILACHRLPNNSVIIRFNKRTQTSAWAKLVDQIKTGGDRSMNFFANFHLTNRRSKLVYELRQYKKQSKIFKFYCDENGSISIKFTEDKNEKKTKITFHHKNTSDDPEKTLTVDELSKLVQAHK